MAFKPSEKRNRDEEDLELNITPIMNLMVVLIPLLLSVAQLTELSLLEYLPPAEAAATEDGAATPPDEGGGGERAKINLLVNLAEEGLQVSIFGAVDNSSGEYFFEIPLTANQTYDWNALTQRLVQIKQDQIGAPIGVEQVQDEATGELKEIPKFKFSDAEEVSITAVGQTPFQTIIDVIDASRVYKEGSQEKPLFPIPLLKQFQ